MSGGKIRVLVGTLVILGAMFALSMPVAFMRTPETEASQVVNLPVVMRPAGNTAGNQMVTHEVTAEEVARTEKFWSLERRNSALAVDVAQVSEAEASEIQAATAAEIANSGPVQVVSGTSGDEALTQQAKQLYPDQWADTSIPAEDPNLNVYYTYPAPFTRYLVNAYTESWGQYPFRAIGKLFFTIPNTAGTYVCSASVMGGRALWTAGHCLYTPGKGWHQNVVFYPAYRAGAIPYGGFTASALTVLTPWYDTGNHGYDIAAVIVNDKQGSKISQWVGSLGSMFNTYVKRDFHTFGYPGNFYSGNYLIACSASIAELDFSVTPNSMGIGCDMGGGSSGGPWVVNYQPYASGAINYVNGVTSYGYVSRPAELFASYFGPNAASLYNSSVVR